MRLPWGPGGLYTSYFPGTPKLLATLPKQRQPSVGFSSGCLGKMGLSAHSAPQTKWSRASLLPCVALIPSSNNADTPPHHRIVVAMKHLLLASTKC